MKISILFSLSILITMIITPRFTIDFGSNTLNSKWRVLSDNVMGGLSEGRIQYTENSLIFTGKTSLANNGGFSSIRSTWETRDLSTFEKVNIRFKSKGQHFALTLETEQRWFMPYYKKTFTTSEEAGWQEVSLNLSDFKEYRIGQETGNKISKNELAQIIRIGIVTNDKVAIPFELEIDWLLFE